MLVEINGLTAADLALDETVETHTGARFRMLAPLVMLKAKLYNLISLVHQERPQDLRHVRMLLIIVPHYLREMAAELRTNQATARDLLGDAAANSAEPWQLRDRLRGESRVPRLPHR